ncbi:hypothetical protein QT13_19220 [Pectobacterium brasiliense]|uniref:hypothetical protein n=1 Tax=Pectobacterium brasiliense TaxID=180957 RepID=UPI00057F16F5|nr:hypothetical protein [Pectobacterium brasiliense]KHS64159.1 hypothetical protein QT13_19220 [Pectobacterium brasiliense]
MITNGITRAFYNIKFDALIESCSFLHEGIKKEERYLRDNYQHELECVDEEHRYAYENFLEDKSYNLSTEYPNLLWSSYYLLAYSMFENFINEICNEASNKIDTDIDLKDLNGQGLVRARIFLLKVIHIDSFLTNENWEEIKFMGELRNIIAHTTGRLDYNNGNHKKLSEKIKRRNDVTLTNEYDKGADVFLNKDFLISAIKLFKSSVNELGMKKINIKG